jgi:hypothetical protein
MGKAANNSVRKEIFRSSMLFSCSILIVFSVILANVLYRYAAKRNGRNRVMAA